MFLGHLWIFGNVLGHFAMFLDVRKFWDIFGIFWRIILGHFWHILVHVGKLWDVFGKFRIFWYVLVFFGKICDVL